MEGYCQLSPSLGCEILTATVDVNFPLWVCCICSGSIFRIENCTAVGSLLDKHQTLGLNNVADALAELRFCSDDVG